MEKIKRRSERRPSSINQADGALSNQIYYLSVNHVERLVFYCVLTPERSPSSRPQWRTRSILTGRHFGELLVMSTTCLDRHKLKCSSKVFIFNDQLLALELKKISLKNDCYGAMTYIKGVSVLKTKTTLKAKSNTIIQCAILISWLLHTVHILV